MSAEPCAVRSHACHPAVRDYGKDSVRAFTQTLPVRVGADRILAIVHAGLQPGMGALTARQSPAVAEVWAREAVGRPGVEAELRAFAETAGKRLGEDGVRDLLRGARGAQGGPEAREGLAGIGRALAVAGEGQRAHAAAQEWTREAERERLGLRQGRGMRM